MGLGSAKFALDRQSDRYLCTYLQVVRPQVFGLWAGFGWASSPRLMLDTSLTAISFSSL